MAIDPISNVTQLIEALRQQISATKAGAPASAAQNVRSSGGTAHRPDKKSARSTDRKALERKLHARIANLQGQGNESFEASTRIFIEGVLTWEFGEGLSQDPRFHQMLDDILHVITQDNELRDQFEVLFARMKE